MTTLTDLTRRTRALSERAGALAEVLGTLDADVLLPLPAARALVELSGLGARLDRLAGAHVDPLRGADRLHGEQLCRT